jgi:cell division protein FtsB
LIAKKNKTPQKQMKTHYKVGRYAFSRRDVLFLSIIAFLAMFMVSLVIALLVVESGPKILLGYNNEAPVTVPPGPSPPP